MEHKKKGKMKIVAIIISCLLVVSLGGFYIYTLDYYRADANAVQTLSTNMATIEKQGNMTVFYPDKKLDIKKGLIFYPGGKVEATAYAPLLEKISQKGVTCVLLTMPFNLAVFDVNAADKVYGKIPDISNWYIAGHSLGGAMASSYVEKNSAKLKGLILLGAYPVNNADIPTLAIYGSEDQGLDKSKLESVRSKMQITGGNHAYFGNYGEQKGDGVAVINREEQQAQAVAAIIEFIKK